MKTLEFKKPTKNGKVAEENQKKPKGKAKKGIERRKVKRLPVKMLVDYRSKEGNYLFDFSYNLGSGGVFIHTKKPHPIDTHIKLTFTLPNTEASFEVEGKVMWHQPAIDKEGSPAQGMGIQFVGLTDQQREILHRYIQHIEKPATDTPA